MLSYTGKLVAVIKSKLSWLDMSVCKLDCNEDIFVTLCNNNNNEYLPLLLHIILNNTQWYICSTPEGGLEVHEMFYILEGCNETLHNGVTELHNGSFITLLGEYDS